MKKLISLILVLALAGLVPPAYALPTATTYKYELAVVDENGQPITSNVSVIVKTRNTDTTADVWSTEDNTTGTLTATSGTLSGQVTPNTTTGSVVFYSTATSHDVVVTHFGRTYYYLNATPGGERRLTVRRGEPEIRLNGRQAVASAADLNIPDAGHFFRVTGTTDINRISETGSQVGRRVLLLFSGSTLNIGAAGNIDLAGNPGTLLVGAGTLLEFVWDGTTWIMIGRAT